MKRDGNTPVRRESANSPRNSYQRRAQYSVYIGNLAWSVDENLVREMVSDVVGADSFTAVRIAIDKETGRSKGFGHVDFTSAATAQRAIDALNNLELEGRTIRADMSGNKQYSTYDRFGTRTNYREGPRGRAGGQGERSYEGRVQEEIVHEEGGEGEGEGGGTPEVAPEGKAPEGKAPEGKAPEGSHGDRYNQGTTGSTDSAYGAW
jgi:RNA recognition motif-containing protein